MKIKISPLAVTLVANLLLALSSARVAPAAQMVKTVTETQKLTESENGEETGFGDALAISGNLAVVGYRNDYANFPFGGSASIYAYDGTSWVLQAKVTPSDPAQSQLFGSAVAISGNMVLIGAPHDSTLGLDTGAVYVFAFNGTTWTQQAKFYFDGEAEAGDDYQFGAGIAVSGNTAVIGAPGFYDPGAAYVFTFNGTAWTQQATLTTADEANLDSFGTSIAMSGNRVLISASGDDPGGAAYTFTTTDGTHWTQEAKLIGLDTAAGDSFGYDVALSGNLALIGAPDREQDRGAAYIFTFDGTSWTQQTKLRIAGAKRYNSFGSSVALSDTTAIVGANNFLEPGTVYQFSLRRNVWQLRAEYVASDEVGGNYLGVTVALDGNTLMSSADNTFHPVDAGAVYVFKVAR